MIDGYGRTIDYVRISVTDRCNLRCVYCMPEEGVSSISHEEILRFGEIERVCQILAENGIQKIKLTGGEPLVRRRLPELAAALKQIPGIKSLTITTMRWRMRGLIQSRSAWIRWMRRCTGSSHAGMRSKRSDAAFGRRSRKAGCRSR